MRYSGLGLIRGGFNGHRHWRPAWRQRTPRSDYDVVIVGGGGQGLATAYYLAKDHGIANVAVLDRGWIGGGNTGRNTTVIRSNYLYPESAALYDFSLKLYEQLGRELNYNIMFRQSGFVSLIHDEHDLNRLSRLCTAMRLNGIEARMLAIQEIRAKVPLANFSPGARFPVIGGFYQPAAGVARHDAVAWAYARAADRLGVHIIQQCEVTGFRTSGDRVTGVQTSRGPINAPRIGLAAAGHSSVLARLAGLRLPITSYALQAMVTEPVKPVLDPVVLCLASGTYISQSDKGEFVIGGGLDLYPSYAQRGNLPTVEATAAAAIDLFPALAGLKLLRQWAGNVDVTIDSSPIIDRSPVGGLYLNCGWGTGGFKAIPAGGYCFAHLLAHDVPHPLSEGFGLNRFRTGALIDEAAAAAIAH
jgi:sarcosine oxidase subunit beta